MKNNTLNVIKSNTQQYGLVIAMIIIVLFFFVLTNGVLLAPLNVTNIVLQNSYILILAIGMLPVIVVRSFDLSVGSVAAFVGSVAAISMVQSHMPVPLVIIICLLLGVAVGIWQGFWIAYVGVPAFVVTLSSMLLFRGLTLVVLDGRSIGPFPDSFKALSSSFLPDPFEVSGIHITTALIGIVLCALLVYMTLRSRRNKQKYGFEVAPMNMEIVKIIIMCAAILLLTYFFAAYRGLPGVMILVVILIVVYTFITSNTVIGRRLYALGGNPQAAALSGIRTKRLTLIAFINLGVLAALAGLIFASRLNAATPKAGTGFELDAIAACFIGGASIAGGEGKIIGAIIGALIMGIINNGMSIMGISIDWQQSIKGLVLLLAVAYDVYNKSKK